MRKTRLTELADQVLSADLQVKTAQAVPVAVELSTDLSRAMVKLSHQIKEVANSEVDVSYADIAAFVKHYAP